MRARVTALLTLLSLGAMLRPASAQSPADLEPGVQTSPERAEAVAPQKPPATVAPQRHAVERKTTPPAAAAKNASHEPAAGTKGSKDRIELGTTQITGNRELPKVMYVVPWRKSDLGDFAGRPPNSLLDEALTPVDRDVFRRQNRYYEALEGAAAPATAPASQSGSKAAAEPAQERRDEK